MFQASNRNGPNQKKRPVKRPLKEVKELDSEFCSQNIVKRACLVFQNMNDLENLPIATQSRLAILLLYKAMYMMDEIKVFLLKASPANSYLPYSDSSILCN